MAAPARRLPARLACSRRGSGNCASGLLGPPAPPAADPRGPGGGPRIPRGRLYQLKRSLEWISYMSAALLDSRSSHVGQWELSALAVYSEQRVLANPPLGQDVWRFAHPLQLAIAVALVMKFPSR